VNVTAEPLPASTGVEVIPRRFCWLCNREGMQLYVDTVDWLFGVPGNWGIRRCLSCDVAWLDPQPVPKDIDKLYAHYYTHNRTTPLTRLGRLRHATLLCVLERLGYSVDRPKEILPRVLSYVRSVARAEGLEVMSLPAAETGALLDVGCGNGEFIARMRSLGWTVFGVDPDITAVSYARSRGLEVSRGTISDLPVTSRYDVITLNHVIEHVIDPVCLLDECRKRLRPTTGRLIITTPNINSLGHWWFSRHWRGLEVPRHLILFSQNGLRECVQRAGLSLCRLRTETRLARMIYSPSVCAKRDERDVGQRTGFEVGTKIAAYLFQGLEDLLLYVKKDVGEELLCVCAAPAEV
jgi:2-polyprenyl-3-methyl-5-hydroxy-6-metoxy-1,4-benzoquinol methylase